MGIRLTQPNELLDKILHKLGVTAGGNHFYDEIVDMIACEFETRKAHETWVLRRWAANKEMLMKMAQYTEMAGTADEVRWVRDFLTELNRRGEQDQRRSS